MKLQGVILDWAGTVIDHGSCAPVAALRGVFAEAGTPITAAEARQSMGVAKKTHIARILELPDVRGRWLEANGRAPESHDVDELYRAFVPKQIDVLRDHSTLIEGVVQAAARMRARRLKIGTTTGYTREMLGYLLERAQEQGFVPDYSTCPDDVPAGRPAPFMCYLNALQMQVFPMSALVKIGDTPVDIQEGVNAGMWTIGISRTGNEIGLSSVEWNHLGEDERTRRLANANEVLMGAGAHYVAESVAECDEILNHIQEHLELGRKP